MYKYIIIIVIVFNYHFFYIELYIYKNKIINRYKMSSNVIEDGDNNEALLPTEKENPTKQFKKIKKIQKRTNNPKFIFLHNFSKLDLLKLYSFLSLL